MDHETDFADRTKSLLDLHEISHVAEVRLAELRQLNLNGEEFQWYDLDAFRDLHEIDLLLIDGPPGLPCETARYPALNVLQSRLAPSAVVILDDADRAGEQTIVQRWITEVTGLRRDREIFNRQAVLTLSPAMIMHLRTRRASSSAMINLQRTQSWCCRAATGRSPAG